ncbi:MAG: GPW/gp25 family protein [Gammaproteobacteria bacterium]|nr:GPW/gp25 family protein [Gammaproteobacteria bacterium]
MANVDFPYHFDAAGGTAETDYADHIRDMIHQVLFTSPGERVNRPTFGSGLLQMVFAPNSVDLSVASQMLVQSALQEWLGDLIVVDTVEVQGIDSALHVRVDYLILKTQQRQVAEFDSGGVIP